MNREKLFNDLDQALGFASPEIREAFWTIDRKDFVLPEFRQDAYFDTVLPIGYGSTISQPFTVLFMFNLLNPQSGEKVLDVGSGSGWTTAMLAKIVGNKGKVLGLERVLELVLFGRNNLAKYRFKNVQIFQAKKELGQRQQSPYDKILVSAAARKLPQELVEQLKVGGRLVIPIGYSIWKIDKISKDEILKEEFPGFAFVPLR